MVINLKSGNGSIKKFDNKEELFDFAKNFRKDICFGENKAIDKIKKCNNYNSITISQILDSLSGNYKRI